MRITIRKRSKLLAVVLAALTAVSTMSAAASAFTDPADVYAQFMSGGTTGQETDDNNTDPPVTSEADDEEEYVGDLSDEASDEPDNNGGGSGNDSSPVKKPAEEVTITGFKSTVYVGDTFSITYRLKPSKSDDTVTYSSSSKSVAKVSSDGKVTAVGEGTALITVKASSGVKDRFTLTVKAAPDLDAGNNADGASENDTSENDSSEEEASGNTQSSSQLDKSKALEIELQHSSVTLVKGETFQIRYGLFPKNCTDTVSFRTLSKSVASVDSSGLVTAVGKGNTRIVLTAGSGVMVKLSVTVIELDGNGEDGGSNVNDAPEYDENGNLKPSRIVLDEHSTMLRVGEKTKLKGKIYPKGTVFSITYSSSDTSVAKVSEKGTVTGVGEGTCVITATTDNGKYDELYITVYGDVIKGIDVSKWNGEINWKLVKNSGMADFAMIRASYGYEDKDPMLKQNVQGCEKYGIPYGFYHYTYARTVSEAKKEAKYFLNAIKSYSPEYPVVLDIEEDFYKTMSKRQVTDIVTTFMEELESAGYYAMIYSYAKFFDDNLIYEEIKDYDVWVACWGDREKLADSYTHHFNMWQYSETGTVPGIDEDVDLNYAYKNYREIIRKYRLNNLQ
ncbi:MAG: GH25 family lysozyme [Huintestinicola sp.]